MYAKDGKKVIHLYCSARLSRYWAIDVAFFTMPFFADLPIKKANWSNSCSKVQQKLFFCV
jgi:hypothetical protein